jgi:hypothetical protein
LSLGCTSSPTEPDANGTLTLRFGQTVVAGGTTVSFTDILDSRCPRDVVCAWEGDAAVRLESGGQHLILHTAGSAGPKEGSLAGLTIALVEVRPARVSENPPQKSDYSVTLDVSRER